MKTQWRALQLGRSRTKVRMQAMAEGVRALGGLVETCEGDLALWPWKELPLFAFTSGMLEYEADEREQLSQAQIPLIVMDCGYFNRAKSGGDPYGYNQVGFDGLCWVPPSPQPSSRYDALGLPPLAEPRGFSTHPTTRRVALVLGQVPNDTQHGLSADQLCDWLRIHAQHYQHLGWKIVWRPHPKAKAITFGDEDEYQTPDIPFDKAIANVDRVITYNSTAGLEAIRQGVGVTCSIKAHYYGISGYGFDLCPKEKVLDYFHRLAWAQWTTGELAAGEPLKFLNTIRRILP